MDGEKAGLWKGLSVTCMAKRGTGTTSMMPADRCWRHPTSASCFRSPPGPTRLTAVKATQYLTDDVVFFGGKLNMLDELVQTLRRGARR